MKRHIKYFLLVLVTIGWGSCTKKLDEKVYSTITEQGHQYTVADFGPTVAGVYSPLLDYCLGYWQTQEITAASIVMPPNASGWDDGGIYRKLHYHTWNADLLQINVLWDRYYRGVLLCNNAIAKIENGTIPAPSVAEKTQALAELRAVRAYYYWVICDNFGDAPLVTTNGTDMPDKTARKEIYNFIVKELTEAIPNLSEVQGGTEYGRINKWAGKTLLANVYLNAEVYTGTARWTECIAQCNDIINSGKCTLSANYKDSFKAYGVESSQEVLFTIPYDFNKGVFGNYLHLNSWHSELKKKYLLSVTPNGAGSIKGITQFINTYQQGDGRLDDTWLSGQQFDAAGKPLYGTYDLVGRPLVFSKDIPSGNYTNEMEGYRMNKYEVPANSQWCTDTDIPLFRYSEVLMMKAECMLRTNQPGAGALVTQVRQRAFKSDPAKATVTDAQLQQNSSYQFGYVENYKITDPGNQAVITFGRMYDELSWEFAWEGHTRRDMIRFGIFTKKSWLSHKPQGDYRSVFPVPQYIIAANPKLKQTAGY